MSESSESISIQDDLRVLNQWLSQAGDSSNTSQLHESIISEILKTNDPTTSTMVTSKDVLPLLRGRGTKQIPDSVNQHVAKAVRDEWWAARKSKYYAYAKAHDARPLKLAEKGTKPISFSYEIDVSKPDSVLVGTVIHYQRDFIDPSEMTWIGRLLYPNGVVYLKGWRKMLWFTKKIVYSLFFILSWYAATVAWVFRPSQNAWALVNTLILMGMTYFIYKFIIIPEINFLTKRMKEVFPFFLKFSTLDKPEAIWELAREDKRGKTSSIEMVRWHGECPICKSIVELANDEPEYKGYFIGRCRESVEHIFSFDRVTGEGRALRSAPKIKNEESR